MLDAHRRAFEHLQGVCRRGIYDNLKTAVKNILKGKHRNLQERFVQFSSHYLYEPEFCNPARGNEKGRVENKIGYIRRNFFAPIPHFSSIEELNSRLLSFAEASSRIKTHPEFAEKTCYETYEEEKDKLIELPPYGFDCCRVSTLLYRTRAQFHLTTTDTQFPVSIRSYGHNQQVLNPYHYLGVLARKPGALRDGLPFKNWKLPSVFEEYRILLNDKYPDGDRYFAKTLILLKDWPLMDVVEAVKKAIGLGILGDSYILRLLRQSEHPEGEIEYLSIKIELARYKAKQVPLTHYDRVLRFKTGTGKTEGKG